MPPKILVPLGKITRQNENNPRFVELMEATLSITHVLFYSHSKSFPMKQLTMCLSYTMESSTAT